MGYEPAGAGKPIDQQITGAASTVVTNNLTANRNLVSDASGKISQGNAITANRLIVSDANGLPSGLAALTATRALVTDAGGLPTASTATANDLLNINGGATVNTGVTIVDGDGFVMNDGGTMIQASANQVANYVRNNMNTIYSYAPLYRFTQTITDRSQLYSWAVNPLYRGWGLSLDFNSGWNLTASHNTAPATYVCMKDSGAYNAARLYGVTTPANSGSIASYSAATAGASYAATGIVSLTTDASKYVNFSFHTYNPTATSTIAIVTVW